MSTELTAEAREVLDQIDESCQTAHDNFDEAELRSFSTRLKLLIDRWRTVWRTGGDD